MPEESLEDLINQSKHSSFAAFKKLVELHQDMVYRLTFRLLANEHDAEDMVQEIFIRVWENLQKYNSGYAFSTWVYKIATNMCYDMLKSKQYINKSKNEAIDDLAVTCELFTDPCENEIDNRQLANIIKTLTMQLSPKQKLVFTLSDIEALSTREISQITGLSAARIKSNLYLARQHIRKKLEQF